MRKINPEHISVLIDLINHGPYFELLSIVFKDLGVGYSLLEVDVERKHHNPFGATQGGVYASVVDTASYWSTYCDHEEDTGFVSLDLKVNYLAPIKYGKMIVEGKRIKVGKTISLAEAVVTNQEGKILVKGTSTLMVTPGIQTIKEAIGLFHGDNLPPKFID